MTKSTFFSAASDFVDNVLPNSLAEIANNYNKEKDLGLIVHLVPSPVPETICEISDLGMRVFEIRYSTIFAHKLLCLLKLFEAHWDGYHSRPRIFTFDHDHPYDSHVWDYPRDESYAFGGNTVLERYFSWRRGARSVEDFESFCHDVNNAQIGGFAFIGFSMNAELSEHARNTALDFFAFMVLHELAHVARKHDMRLQLWPYQKLCRRTSQAGRIYRYRHKAIECDADFAAFAGLAEYHFARKRHIFTFQKLLETIAIGFCLFDTDRRNTFDLKSVDGLYPAPEIRFEILCHMLEQGSGMKLHKMRDSIMSYCIRSFQGLGLIGAFYLFSGPLSTLDDQFFKELAILDSVEAEIRKILMQSNVIFASSGGKTVEVERRILPLGMTEAQYKERLGKDFVAMISKDPSWLSEESLSWRSSARLAALRTDGTIRSGDHLLLLVDEMREIRPEMKRWTTMVDD